MTDWRNKPITDKQRECIKGIYENCEYSIPYFEGKTRGEASDYIDRYIKMSHESLWAIEHGY